MHHRALKVHQVYRRRQVRRAPAFWRKVAFELRLGTAPIAMGIPDAKEMLGPTDDTVGTTSSLIRSADHSYDNGVFPADDGAHVCCC